MRTILMLILGAFAMGLAMPATVDAQSRRDRGRVLERHDDDSSDDRRVILDRDGRVVVVDGGRRDRARRGNGPKFCRNGQGHPVHGREWCREKGFGLGGDVLFERDRRTRRYDRNDDWWDRVLDMVIESRRER